MSKSFRLACAVNTYTGDFKRPPAPAWLKNPNCSNTWRKIYQATPPWITKDQVNRMRSFYLNCPRGCHVDHIVPLAGDLACGLHVPWNLQYLPPEVNLYKSNKTWPGHPFEQKEMFSFINEPHQLSLQL